MLGCIAQKSTNEIYGHVQNLYAERIIQTFTFKVLYIIPLVQILDLFTNTGILNPTE